MPAEFTGQDAGIPSIILTPEQVQEIKEKHNRIGRNLIDAEKVALVATIEDLYRYREEKIISLENKYKEARAIIALLVSRIGGDIFFTHRELIGDIPTLVTWDDLQYNIRYVAIVNPKEEEDESKTACMRVM